MIDANANSWKKSCFSLVWALCCFSTTIAAWLGYSPLLAYHQVFLFTISRDVAYRYFIRVDSGGEIILDLDSWETKPQPSFSMISLSCRRFLSIHQVSDNGSNATLGDWIVLASNLLTAATWLCVVFRCVVSSFKKNQTTWLRLLVWIIGTKRASHAIQENLLMYQVES